ncbi:MAG: outer membrane beta-barrel protein [Elusimicrobia bacterium]|nr:outer membrane beta-barrel protein [Elusimicrobiota bacterium]
MPFFILAWLLFPLSAAAETDLFVHTGPSIALRQDIKAREFDLPGRQARFEERSVVSAPGLAAGMGLRHFFNKTLGLQGEFSYSQTQLSLHMDGTPFGSFTMQQRRYGFLLSMTARRNIGSLSSLYGNAGVGWVYADFDYIPFEWNFGGRMSVGIDLASARKSSFFIELGYLWHDDVGAHIQSPGYHLKTSGNPDGNPASTLFGIHADTQVVGLSLGMRFKLSTAPR